MEIHVRAIDHEPRGPTARSVLVVAILAELRARQIPVAVLNGVTGPIPFVGRDVDLLIYRKDVSAVAHVARAVAAASGWNYATARWPGSWYPRGLYQQVFHRIEGGRILNVAFDLICSDGIAAGLITAYSPQLLHGGTAFRDGIPTTMVGAYMKSAFIKALAGIERGFHNVERARPIPRDVRQHIAGIFGDRFLRTYEDCVMRRGIRLEWRNLRRRAQRAYVFRHPIAALRNGLVSLIRRTLGSRLHHVRSVAIVGPGGVARSSAMDYARRALEDAFLDVRRRDSSFPMLRHPRPIRGAAVRLLFERLHNAVGYWLQDRRSTSSEIPVNVCEESALHIAVDPLRFAAPHGNGRLWLCRLLGPIDRLIVLRDRPQDVTLPTAFSDAASRPGFRKAVCRKGLVTQIIDIQNRTPEAVGVEIARAIIEAVSVGEMSVSTVQRGNLSSQV